MKRKGKKLAIFLLTASLLTGCGNPINKMKENTVYINKDGEVESLSIESFDKDYYSQEELKQFIDKEVTAQQEERGDGSISLKDFEVKEKEASLKMVYSSAEDYEAFTDTELEQGDYTKDVLEEGETLVDAKTEKEVEELPEEVEGLKYVKIQDPEDIQVLLDGTILYYSNKAEFLEEHLIKIPAGETCVILYQDK